MTNEDPVDTTSPDTTSPDTTSPDTTSPDTTSPVDTTSPDTEENVSISVSIGQDGMVLMSTSDGSGFELPGDLARVIGLQLIQAAAVSAFIQAAKEQEVRG